jgi:hypothetical protein
MVRSIKQVRRTEKQIRSILCHQQNYKGTVIEFCKARKIHKATFYNWRNKYGVDTESEQAFVPLQFCDHLQAASLFAEIELAPEVTVRLFQKVDASWFKALL